MSVQNKRYHLPVFLNRYTQVHQSHSNEEKVGYKISRRFWTHFSCCAFCVVGQHIIVLMALSVSDQIILHYPTQCMVAITSLWSRKTVRDQDRSLVSVVDDESVTGLCFTNIEEKNVKLVLIVKKLNLKKD